MPVLVPVPVPTLVPVPVPATKATAPPSKQSGAPASPLTRAVPPQAPVPTLAPLALPATRHSSGDSGNRSGQDANAAADLLTPVKAAADDYVSPSGPDADASREIERSILADLSWASSSRHGPAASPAPAQSLFSESPLARPAALAPAVPFSPFGAIGARRGESPSAATLASSVTSPGIGIGMGMGPGFGLGFDLGVGAGYGLPASPSLAPAPAPVAGLSTLASPDPFSFTLPWLEPTKAATLLPAPLADWAAAQAAGAGHHQLHHLHQLQQQLPPGGVDVDAGGLDRSLDLLLDDDEEEDAAGRRGAQGAPGGWGVGGYAADDYAALGLGTDGDGDSLSADGLNVRAPPYQPFQPAAGLSPAPAPAPAPRGTPGPPPGFG